MPEHLGSLEQLVLLALLRLGDGAYGVAVQQDIAQRTGRTPSFATIYATLNRLEDKELITSRLGDSTPERGGRRKKLFALRAAGHRAIQASIRDLRTMAKGLDVVGNLP